MSFDLPPSGCPRPTRLVIASPAEPGVAIHLEMSLLGCLVTAQLAMTPTMAGNYYVYILASRKNGTLYVGVTSSLERRVWQHRNKTQAGFTAKYGVATLVYFERFEDVLNAIAREKQLKSGSRAKKVALIERENAEWRDLSADWW